jgi:two-component system, LytTR family, sensor kinase
MVWLLWCTIITRQLSMCKIWPVFLRYVLKSRDSELVTLREEMNMIQMYILLHQTRLGDNLKVDITIPDSCLLLCLPPFALQVLVENCIKHNVVSHAQPLHICIFANDESITVSNGLQCKNAVESTGQGLTNLRERYRFFTTREIDVVKSDTSFLVCLPLLMFEK